VVQRIGIFGGTFDPVHLGHLNAASRAATILNLDQVVFVPTGQPWRKHTVHASAEDRLKMVGLAVADDARFSASRLEVERLGPTYTIDTLRELRASAQYRDSDLFFITGADAIAEIDSWKDSDQLADLAEFVAVTRPGCAEWTSLVGVDPPIPVIALDVPGLDISSTMVRERISRRERIDSLTVPQVIAYLDQHRLYTRGGSLEGDA
jgi:nicotinate-nucleotide adenylyltransferase